MQDIDSTVQKLIDAQEDKIKYRHGAYAKYEQKYSEAKIGFDAAYQELFNGKKKGCWMWWIFPILKWEPLPGHDGPTTTSEEWFIPDKTGIPFLLYNIDQDQILIRRLYGIMRIACEQLSPSYNRQVFFEHRFQNKQMGMRSSFFKGVPGEDLFAHDWRKFKACVKCFLKAVAAILNRYEMPKLSSIWKSGEMQLHYDDIVKYWPAVQKARPMEPYHELWHLLHHMHTNLF